ncbi:GTPase-activating protein, partial [Quaeritorhiza haematococci]
MFGISSELLTERIRQMTFAAILRQDISFFDGENDEFDEAKGGGGKYRRRFRREKKGKVKKGGKGKGMDVRGGNGASTSVNTSTTTGALTSALASDATKVQGVSGVTLGTLLTVTTNLVGGMVVALSFGWKLALVAISCLPILISAGVFRMKILTYFSEKAKKSYQQSAQLATEAVASIKTVQSLNLEPTVHERYLRILHKPLMEAYQNAWTHTLLYAVSSCVNFMINALVFWYGGTRLMAYEGYSVQQMFVVFMAVVFGSMSASRIFASAPDLMKAKEAGEDILKLLNRKPRIDTTDSPNPTNPTTTTKVDRSTTKGTIELRNVNFSYPTRPHLPVLKNFSLRAEPGQFIALVGPSGSGKSTTISLFERFYDPTAGSICVDGKDVRELDVK